MSDSLPPPAPPAPRPRSGRRVFAAGALSALLLIGIIGASVVIGFRLASDAEESNLVTPTSAAVKDSEVAPNQSTGDLEHSASTTEPASTDTTVAATCARSSTTRSNADILFGQVYFTVNSEVRDADFYGDRYEFVEVRRQSLPLLTDSLEGAVTAKRSSTPTLSSGPDQRIALLESQIIADLKSLYSAIDDQRIKDKLLDLKDALDERLRLIDQLAAASGC